MKFGYSRGGPTSNPSLNGSLNSRLHLPMVQDQRVAGGVCGVHLTRRLIGQAVLGPHHGARRGREHRLAVAEVVGQAGAIAAVRSAVLHDQEIERHA